MRAGLSRAGLSRAGRALYHRLSAAASARFVACPSPHSGPANRTAMPSRPPRLRPLLLAIGLLPAGAAAVELGVRAADSYCGGALSRPACPTAAAVPCPLARHALPAFGTVAAGDPDTGEVHVVVLNSLGLRVRRPRFPSRSDCDACCC